METVSIVWYMPRRPGRPAGPRPDGDEIRRLRVDRGLTAAQLGATVGYSEDAIWLAERGGSMSDILASRLAKALSTPGERVTVDHITVDGDAGGDDSESDAEMKVPA